MMPTLTSLSRYNDTRACDINLPHPLLAAPTQYILPPWPQILSRITLLHLRLHSRLRLWAVHAYLKLVARTLPLPPMKLPTASSANDLTNSALLTSRLRIRVLLQHCPCHLVHPQYGSVLHVIYSSSRSPQSLRPYHHIIKSSRHQHLFHTHLVAVT